MRSRPARDLQIQLLYVAGCPSARAALSRLRRLLAQHHVRARIVVTKVRSRSQADALQFFGSPTVRVDGRDVDEPHGTVQGESCRLYRDGDALRPIPSDASIRSALFAHIENS
jgi:hypothetical protein